MASNPRKARGTAAARRKEPSKSPRCIRADASPQTFFVCFDARPFTGGDSIWTRGREGAGAGARTTDARSRKASSTFAQRIASASTLSRSGSSGASDGPTDDAWTRSSPPPTKGLKKGWFLRIRRRRGRRHGGGSSSKMSDAKRAGVGAGAGSGAMTGSARPGTLGGAATGASATTKGDGSSPKCTGDMCVSGDGGGA